MIKRDYKKLYKKAIEKKIKNVVGVDIEFKKPKNPDIVIKNNGSKQKLYQNYYTIIKEIKKKNKKIY